MITNIIWGALAVAVALFLTWGIKDKNNKTKNFINDDFLVRD